MRVLDLMPYDGLLLLGGLYFGSGLYGQYAVTAGQGGLCRTCRAVGRFGYIAIHTGGCLDAHCVLTF